MIRSEQLSGLTVRGAVGEPLHTGDGLVVSVVSFKVYKITEYSGTPNIVAQVRSENPGTTPGSNPDMAIFCAGDPDPGPAFIGSTWEAHEDLPPMSFDEGLLHLGLPEAAIEAHSCDDAVLRAQPFQASGIDVPLGSVEVPVPTNVIDRYLAGQQP